MIPTMFPMVLALFAQQEPDLAQMVRTAKVTLPQAAAAAVRETKDGVVVQAELEFEKDHVVWSLDVARGKKVTEVLLDAATGAVIELSEEAEDNSALVTQAKASLTDAVAAVLKQHAGTAVFAHLELAEGRPSVKVSVFADGKKADYAVDVGAARADGETPAGKKGKKPGENGEAREEGAEGAKKKDKPKGKDAGKSEEGEEHEEAEEHEGGKKKDKKGKGAGKSEEGEEHEEAEEHEGAKKKDKKTKAARKAEEAEEREEAEEHEGAKKNEKPKAKSASRIEVEEREEADEADEAQDPKPAATGPAPAARHAAEFTDSFGEEDRDLGPTGKNPWFVLQPGYVQVLEGKDGGKEAVNTITVLDETKTIGGIEARVVEEREVVGGVVKEITRDYFAISKRTNNVYYLGEDVDVYANGKVVDHEGSWLHGQKGAHYGLMMPGVVLIGARFQQETAPDVAMDRCEIASTSGTFECAAGKFEQVLVVEETTPLEKGREQKLYARGVGLLRDGDLTLVRAGFAEHKNPK